MKYYTMHNVCLIDGIYDISFTYVDYITAKKGYSDILKYCNGFTSIWDYIAFLAMRGAI